MSVCDRESSSPQSHRLACPLHLCTVAPSFLHPTQTITRTEIDRTSYDGQPSSGSLEHTHSDIVRLQQHVVRLLYSTRCRQATAACGQTYVPSTSVCLQHSLHERFGSDLLMRGRFVLSAWGAEAGRGKRSSRFCRYGAGIGQGCVMTGIPRKYLWWGSVLFLFFSGRNAAKFVLVRGSEKRRVDGWRSQREKFIRDPTRFSIHTTEDCRLPHRRRYQRMCHTAGPFHHAHGRVHHGLRVCLTPL